MEQSVSSFVALFLSKLEISIALQLWNPPNSKVEEEIFQTLFFEIKFRVPVTTPMYPTVFQVKFIQKTN